MCNALVENEEFLKLVEAGVSTREITRILRCDRTRVREARRYLNAEPTMPSASNGILAEAPNAEEEWISSQHLTLAPSVAIIAAEVRRNALSAYARDEQSPYARESS